MKKKPKRGEEEHSLLPMFGVTLKIFFNGEYKGINMFITEGGCSCDLAGGTLSLPYKQKQEMLANNASVEDFKEAMYKFYHKFNTQHFRDNLNDIINQL